MRKFLPLLALCFSLQGLEYEVQFEDSKVIVVRAKIEAHETAELHRDDIPHLVTAIKGGVLTRIEADGTENVVAFPTGVTIYRDKDPIGEYHRTENRSDEAVELIIINLKPSPMYGFIKNAGTKDIHIEIDLNCPPSEELDNYIQSVATDSGMVEQFDWQNSFKRSMNELFKLVDSENFNEAIWSSNVTDVE